MKKDFSNLLGGAIVSKNSDDTSIRERIVIRKDFKALIPPLAADELQQLEANILKEGVRDPLIIWPVDDSFVLVDGHNRFSVCQKHGLDFPFQQVAFQDDDDVRDWMIRNQLGRRNLSPEQQSYLRGLRYNREKSQGKRTDLTLDQNDLKSESQSTAAALAKEYNVSEATIKRDGEFASGLEVIGNQNPKLKAEILKGKLKLKKKDIRLLVTKSKSEHRGRKNVGKSVIEIAFEYIQSEKRNFKAVCKAIGFNEGDNNSALFFKKWSASQK
jgi:ParB-like chromosome segregation protein Spo0J